VLEIHLARVDDLCANRNSFIGAQGPYAPKKSGTLVVRGEQKTGGGKSKKEGNDKRESSVSYNGLDWRDIGQPVANIRYKGSNPTLRQARKEGRGNGF